MLGAILALTLFAQTQTTSQPIAVILGPASGTVVDAQVLAENPWAYQRVVLMEEAKARSEYDRLLKIARPTQDDIKLLAALRLSLGTFDAVREPHYQTDEIRRGIRPPLQRKER